VKHSKYTVLGYLTLHGSQPVRAIASGLGMDVKTVRRWIAALTDEGAIKVDAIEPRARKITPTVNSKGQGSLFGEPDKASIQTSQPSEPFLSWWRDYPVKRNRALAWKEWRKQKLDAAGDAILQALHYQIHRAEEKKNAREFVGAFPYGAKWLKEKRWHDEL
jgi:hypothetical protein